jgi:adenosylcobyric acid synthase
VCAAASSHKMQSTPSIMLQGTASNAGKSLLATGLCRVLKQDGVNVAPFKAQNMALNSFVTADGLEMGRSQVTQAAACGLAPDVRMNPLLLKPMGGQGCQVVLEGKSIGAWNADDQQGQRQLLESTIDRCYASLASEYDAIVLEGAGSPAEVNLKDRDLVNMAMARKAQSPVLLVGDIDRGGVFAALLGTMMIFDEWERDLVAGFIINRLHGDAAGLEPAVRYIEERCDRPVFGVMPYLGDLQLPEEDGVSFRERYNKSAIRPDSIDIAIIELPHISNFTDLDPLVIEPDVTLRTVAHARELGQPDAIIIPGSKNTAGDLRALAKVGLLEAIQAAANKGCVVVGICAGLQMLGTLLQDEGAVEGGDAEGLGLLPLHTIMRTEKSLAQTVGRHIPSGLQVRGYEIHHGESAPVVAGNVSIVTDEGGALGYASRDGSVWGTYLHGVFDVDAFRRWFLDDLRTRRGIAPLGAPICTYGIEPALEQLADAVRVHIDIPQVYRVMGI